MKGDLVAFKKREPTPFNEEMVEIYNEVKKRRLVWNMMCNRRFTLQLKPLYWVPEHGEPKWLMEMSFKDEQGHPAHTGDRPCPPAKLCTNTSTDSSTLAQRQARKLKAASKLKRSSCPKRGTKPSTGDTTSTRAGSGAEGLFDHYRIGGHK